MYKVSRAAWIDIDQSERLFSLKEISLKKVRNNALALGLDDC